MIIRLVARVIKTNPCGLALALTIFLLAPPGAEAQTTVTLRDGRTYQVETVRGLPTQFASDQIKVQDLGITARFSPDNLDAPPYVRVLLAELLAKGQFIVTVTTPLDPAASATLKATGPGRIVLRFFPQANHPLVWEGIDAPGIHWFPFHFVFEEQPSGTRFEFTQWAQMDDATWKQTTEMIEQAKQRMLKK